MNSFIKSVAKELSISLAHFTMTIFKDPNREKGPRKFYADHFISDGLNGNDFPMENADQNADQNEQLEFVVMKRAELEEGPSYLFTGKAPYNEDNCNDPVKKVAAVLRLSNPEKNPRFFNQKNEYLEPISNTGYYPKQLETITEVAKVYGKKKGFDLEPIESRRFFQINDGDEEYYYSSTGKQSEVLRDLCYEGKDKDKLRPIRVNEGNLTQSSLPWLQGKFNYIIFCRKDGSEYTVPVDEYINNVEKKKACLTEFTDKLEAKGPANIQQLLKKPV